MGRLPVALIACLCLVSPAIAWGDEEGDNEDLSISGPSVLPASPTWNNPLTPVLISASGTYNVPVELLIVLGQYGSNFENRGGVPTIEGGYGVLALRDNILGGNSLQQAAALTGQDMEQIKVDPVLNIQGGAAVLDYLAEQKQIDRSAGLAAWWPVIVTFAGLDKDTSQYFAWQVFSRLEKGWSITNSRGETFGVTPQLIDMDLDQYAPPTTILSPEYQPITTHSPDYPPAAYDQAPSCNYSSATSTKDTVVIHTAEGSYSGTISWINNCNSVVSAHYVVAEDGRVTQMVLESQRAYHASCYNTRGIGIEHEGFASSSSHPTALYNASGDLTADICNAWGIPKQKRTTGPGIIGHVDVTNCCCGTHTDPGAGWNWTYFISRVNGGAPPPPAFDATFNAQSFPSTMTAGTTAIVYAEFVNKGTTSWTHCATKLGTQGPQDRNSPFCTPANWTCAGGGSPGCNRPTDVDQSSVATDAVGRFTFILTAPATPGNYTEQFKLLQEGVTWFGPTITWNIQVIAGQGNLTGTVRNAITTAPISGATVTLGGVGSTSTNGSGVYNFNNVNAGNYTVTVTATGFSPGSAGITINNGATTTQDINLSVTDTENPSDPTNLIVTSTTANSVSLSWTASTDNVGVGGYDIRRNGSIIGSSPTNSYSDMTVSPQTVYTYDVRAKDAAGNVSGFSNAVQAITRTAQAVVFSDGFNGNLNNWTQQTGAFAYSTTVNHGSVTGGGAAFVAATETDQMYHTFTRPFAQARVSGWFWDSKGGWKTGVCGNQYRQGLSLREFGGTAAFIIDNCFNQAVGNPNYFYRKLGGGSTTSVYNTYATRDAGTDCNGTWIYFETTVTPGSIGASPTGAIQLKVIDRAGTTNTNADLTTDFFSIGLARITLGLGASSVNEGYWDDIVFEATAPNVPSMGAPVLATNQIQWIFSAGDNNFFGYEVADSGGTILSPQYNTAGWLARSATSWTETGLTPNTHYSRKVRTWNGTLNSLYSSVKLASTLSPAPITGSVTSASPTGCPGQNMVWTAVGGFGPGHVQYYRYVFDQSATHTWTNTEAVWSSGTLTTLPSVLGNWYLHVRGHNADDVANGEYDYLLPVPDTDNDAVPDCEDGCPNDAGKTAPGVCGCGVSDTDQVSIVEGGQPANSYVGSGGTANFHVGASGAGLTYQWYNASGPLSDGPKYSGVTTNSLQISNVDNGDVSAGPYYVIVSGGCGSPVTSANAIILILSPPQVVAWRSVVTHGSDGPLGISLNASATSNGPNGPTVEPRQGGIQKITVDFDEVVTLLSAAAVHVTGQTTTNGSLDPASDYTAQAGVSLLDDDKLEITFSPPLPDHACYTIAVGGAVQNQALQTLTGDTDCLVRSLAGDVTGDGTITLSDAGLVHAHLGQSATASPALDVDASGGTLNPDDVQAAKASVASPLVSSLCP